MGNNCGMTKLATLWDKTNGLPMGRKIFSIAYSQAAPYFGSIHATVTEMRPNYGEVTIPKRRSVTNHIGTVHAIALCNGVEMAMGALAEMSVPKDKRWLPKGMDIMYTGMADSDITCIAETDPEQWTSDNPDLPVRVKCVTTEGKVVLEGVIKLWVTPKKK